MNNFVVIDAILETVGNNSGHKPVASANPSLVNPPGATKRNIMVANPMVATGAPGASANPSLVNPPGATKRNIMVANPMVANPIVATGAPGASANPSPVNPPGTTNANPIVATGAPGAPGATGATTATTAPRPISVYSPISAYTIRPEGVPVPLLSATTQVLPNNTIKLIKEELRLPDKESYKDWKVNKTKYPLNPSELPQVIEQHHI